MMHESTTASSPAARGGLLQVRRIQSIFASQRRRGADGVVFVRPLPSVDLSEAASDPFLLMDVPELSATSSSSLEAEEDRITDRLGRPNAVAAQWRPMRGFDSLTYVLEGEIECIDINGTKARVAAGEGLLVRAGNGVIRALRDCGGGGDAAAVPARYVTVWTNVPTIVKLVDPESHHMRSRMLTWQPYNLGGSIGTQAKVICGTLGDLPGSHGEPIHSPMSMSMAGDGPSIVAHFDIAVGGRAAVAVPSYMSTALLYVLSGAGRVFNGSRDAAGATVRQGDCVTYASDSNGYLRIQAQETDDAVGTDRSDATVPALSILVLCGTRLNQTVARCGPFVMGTAEEVQQAFQDYKMGTLAINRIRDFVY